jgi:hypothetical protein
MQKNLIKMKIFSYFLFSILCFFSEINLTNSRKNDQTNIFSYFKDRIYSKIEEYQENYQNFLYLMKSLKYHFYDNYHQQPEHKYKLVKRDSNPKRTLYYLIFTIAKPI